MARRLGGADPQLVKPCRNIHTVLLSFGSSDSLSASSGAFIAQRGRGYREQGRRLALRWGGKPNEVNLLDDRLLFARQLPE